MCVCAREKDNGQKAYNDDAVGLSLTHAMYTMLLPLFCWLANFAVWFKMGAYIPENEARAPQTAALLRQMPDVYNAFFSVLEPHQHIDPHWGHYKGYVRVSLCDELVLVCIHCPCGAACVERARAKVRLLRPLCMREEKLGRVHWNAPCLVF
jgi:Aspartyl/Asparaginyl beta-hydroxylase